MVKGMNQFKAHFAGFADRYVLIGGAACYLAMEEAGLEFRVTKDLDMVSERARLNQNNPGHIFTLEDRQIFKPKRQLYWPAIENTEWHRKNVFRV